MRGYAARWEEDNRRPFFAAGKFTSSTDVVWRQSVKGEVAVNDGKVSAILLWDLVKCFESINHDLLLHRCAQYGFDMSVARMPFCHDDGQVIYHRAPRLGRNPEDSFARRVHR
eukprot:121059-Pyramimonas_sp.AAC.1